MKKTISPVAGAGLIMYGVINVIDRFVMHIDNWLFIILMVACSVTVLIGIYKYGVKKL